MMGDLLESIHGKVKSLYRESVRSIAVKTGLHRLVRSLYGGAIVQLTDEVQTHEIAGITVEYKTTSYSDWERQRSFKGELLVMEQFINDLAEEAIVWDIGANMGTYTCLAGQTAENVSVVAFEPAPKNRERLYSNIELNGITATVQKEALDETTRQMGLSSKSDSDGQYSLTEDQSELQVSTTDADSLVDQGCVPQPDIVKIDVEGAELRVLRGMKNVLKEVECLYLEVHPSRIAEYGGSTNEVESCITAAGLDYEKIHERGDQYFLRAVRNDINNS